MNVFLVQPDQLSLRSALLKGRVRKSSVVVLVEEMASFRVVPFHKQRLVLVISAMRHFAEELRAEGFTVREYRLCEAPEEALEDVAHTYDVDAITLMRAASWGVDARWEGYAAKADLTLNFLDNDMFISTRTDYAQTIPAEKSVRMEAFYRSIRKKTGILMEGDKPVGGQWNYDKENRNPLSGDLLMPGLPEYTPDATTEEVIADVERHFSDHFGTLDGFAWPVTRSDADALLRDFLAYRFESFGPYQDAMVDGQDTLYHSLISGVLNIGLLDPEDVCRAAEEAFHTYEVPLNSAEGFIRQILGWREFVYQLYRANMPGYDERNALDADLPLPSFYWDGDTRMRCARESVRPVLERGLSHHIQRLMVTGNFALLAGVSPQALNEWYWLGFVDAWHWAVTPNVIGMATFADGGLMASKPYAASANYLKRMSDYCERCPYDPKEAVGERACPFNALYWDFLSRNEERLGTNSRLALSYKNLSKKEPANLKAMRRRAASIRESMAEAGGV